MRLITDSRGRASWTTTLAIPSIALVVLRYVSGGVDVTVGAVHVVVPAIDGTGAAAVLLMFWGAFQSREWMEKRGGRGDAGAG